MANNILEELLPDFEDMNAVAVRASQVRLQAHMVKDELDTYVAECVSQAYRNPTYWVNGKPPTQTYIERVVAVVGNTQEDAIHIKGLMEQYANLQREVDETRSLLANMRDQVATFQTVSSNRRAGVT